MSADVIQFPRAANESDDDAWSHEEWVGHMIGLHTRLIGALRHDGPPEKVKLSIDDIMELAGAIEHIVGHEYFGDDESVDE